jgi:hypothetical protein
MLQTRISENSRVTTWSTYRDHEVLMITEPTGGHRGTAAEGENMKLSLLRRRRAAAEGAAGEIGREILLGDDSEGAGDRADDGGIRP